MNVDSVNQFYINKTLARRAFDQSARHYDEAAILQREVATRLTSRLEYIKLKPAAILDIGSGTGFCSYLTNKLYPQAHIYALDIAGSMLKMHRNKHTHMMRLKKLFGLNQFHYTVADMESLPLAANSFDLVISSLTFQWANDLDNVFAECYRVLKPGGLLMFTSFGPDTLRELRSCWQQVDANSNHVNQFMDMHDVGDALMRNRFAEPVMDMEMLTVTYHDVVSIMRDLKTIGAHNVTEGRRRSLTGKSKLAQLAKKYEAFRQDGLLPVSHELVYGHAWKSEMDTRQQGDVNVQFNVDPAK